MLAKHKVGSSTLLTRSIIKPLVFQGLFFGACPACPRMNTVVSFSHSLRCSHPLCRFHHKNAARESQQKREQRRSASRVVEPQHVMIAWFVTFNFARADHNGQTTEAPRKHTVSAIEKCRFCCCGNVNLSG
jgi:hypothetical protein